MRPDQLALKARVRPPAGRSGLLRRIGVLAWVGLGMACGGGSESGPSEPVPTRLVVTPSILSLPQSGSAQLDARIEDQDGRPMAGVPVTFESLDPTVATVTSSGLVTATNTLYVTSIVVRAGTLAGTVQVVVTPVAVALVISPDSVDIEVDQRTFVRVQVLDRNGEGINFLEPSLESTNPDLLEVVGGWTATHEIAGTGHLVARLGELVDTVPFVVRVPGGADARASLAGPGYNIAISSSGEVLVASPAVGLFRAQLPGYAFTPPVQAGDSWAVAFNPAGTSGYFGGAGYAKVVTRLDAGGSTTVATSPVLPGTVYDLEVSMDGTKVFAALDEGHVAVLDAGTLAVLALEKVATWAVLHLAVHPQGGRIYASSPFDDRIFELDEATLAVLRTFVSPGTWQGVAVAPGGGTLYAANELGAVQTWDLNTGNAGPALAQASGAFGLQVSPDGASLWTAGHGGEIRRLALPDGSLDVVYPVGGQPLRVAVRTDGSIVAVVHGTYRVDFILP